jgi:hypothetical protein
MNAFGSGLKEIANTLISIATETEQTVTRFRLVNALALGDSTVYSKVFFRFNVVKGHETVGLEKHEDIAMSSDIKICAGMLESLCE